jgi:hypothetical protein
MALRFGKRALNRDGEKVVNVIGDEPAAEEGDEDEDDATNDATTQLVEVIQKRHLPARFFLARFIFGFGTSAEKSCHSGSKAQSACLAYSQSRLRVG